MRTAEHVHNIPAPLPVNPQARVIPYVLTINELAALLRAGEDLADIQQRLAGILMPITIDMLDAAEPGKASRQPTRLDAALAGEEARHG